MTEVEKKEASQEAVNPEETQVKPKRFKKPAPVDAEVFEAHAKFYQCEMNYWW